MRKGERRYDDGMSPSLRYYYRNRKRILQKLKGNPAAAARSKLYRENNAAKVREAQRKRRLANKEQIDRYFAENSDKISAQKKASYAANRERISAERRARYAANPKAFIAKVRAWAAANPEKVKAKSRAWAAANPEKVRILSSTKRARKRNAKGNVSREVAAKLMILQQGKCAVCRCDLSGAKYHLDHIEPLALGGAHDDKNMQLLCKPCNLSKHAKPPIEFMQSRGFLL